MERMKRMGEAARRRSEMSEITSSVSTSCMIYDRFDGDTYQLG